MSIYLSIYRSWYPTFAPFPDTCPSNQPALGQTGVRGANVNCRVWLTDDRNSSVAGVSGLRPGRRYLRYQITV